MEKCAQLVAQLQDIKRLQTRLNQEVVKFANGGAEEIIARIELLKNIYNLRKDNLNLINDFKWEALSNFVRTNNIIIIEGKKQEKIIKFDFAEIVKKTKAFYKRHSIVLSPEFDTLATELWKENREEILREVSTYGYDHILIIPDDLPVMNQLENMMTGDYPHRTDWNAVINNKSENKASKNNVFRLVLTHFVGDLEKSPLLEATVGKSPLQLVQPEDGPAVAAKAIARTKKIISSREGLSIKLKLDGIVCGGDTENLTDTVMAEGLSLDEYLILQRQYYDETGQTMDQKTWSCLLDTFMLDWCLSASLFNKRLSINEVSLEGEPFIMGYRFSRSFSHYAPKKEDTDNNKTDLTWNTVPWRPA